MNRVFTTLALAIWIIALASCSSRTSTSTSDQEHNNPTNPPWAKTTYFTEIDPSFYATHVLKIQKSTVDSIWVLSEAHTLRFSIQKSVLQKRDLKLNLLYSKVFPENERAVDMALHSNGTLSLVLLRTIAGREHKSLSSTIVVQRYDSNGAFLSEFTLKDRGSEHERLYYEVENGVITSTKPFNIEISDSGEVYTWSFFTPHLKIAAIGDELYLLAITYGLKAYKINRVGELLWSKQLLPLHSHMTILSPPEILQVDEMNNLCVAYPVELNVATVYKQHLGAQLSLFGKIDTLIHKISFLDGALLSTQAFGTPEQSEVVVDFNVHADEATVVGVSRVQKSDRPNDTTEWDLVFMRGSLQTGALSLKKWIELDREDIARSVKFNTDGSIMVGGVTHFLQVDSNSWVENGNGFIAHFSHEGEPLQFRKLIGPRHTEIEAFDFANDGTFFFGGFYDGPITHTCDDDHDTRKNCYNKGMLGVSSF